MPRPVGDPQFGQPALEEACRGSAALTRRGDFAFGLDAEWPAKAVETWAAKHGGRPSHLVGQTKRSFPALLRGPWPEKA